MKYWLVKSPTLKGRKYEDIEKQVKAIFSKLKSQTKRKTHLKSKYFKKKKIFFDYFWKHLFQKPVSQRKKRVKFFPCALELIENSVYSPEIKVNPNKKTEVFYRFFGKTTKSEKFAIQIKENKKTKTKQFMSLFPLK